MQNKNLIRFAESFVIIPALTISMPFGGVPKPNIDIVKTPQIVFSQQSNIIASSLLAVNQEVDQQAKILKIQANAIDTYFKEHNMPLEGYGMKMAEEAQKNDLDWRLLPAISARETTGGRSLCKNPKAQNNPFGWGSCKIGFKNFDESIETVAKHLGGNVESTSDHYADKDTKHILDVYNPPSVVKNYTKQVMSIMADIGDEIVTIPSEA